MVASVKERRTRILITLFLLGKDKAHPLFDPKIKQSFSIPSDSPRSRGTIRQMLLDKVIEKEEEGVYRITEEGIKELSLSFPFVRFSVFGWDGKFRIISYEIPEKKRKLRDSLRREISGWGLGPWHRSFWVTPHPIVNDLELLVKDTNWEPFIQAFEGSHLVGEEKVLVDKVWAVSKLEDVYKGIFKKWHETLSNDGWSKERKMKEVVDSYLDVLKADPGLPKELLQGGKWIGHEAWEIFQEMRNILI